MWKRFLDFLSKVEFRQKMRKKGHLADRGKMARRRESELASVADQSLVLGCFMLVLIWGTCSLLLSLSTTPHDNPNSLIEGQYAPQTINAEFDFSYISPEETAKARQEVIDSEPLFFRLSPEQNRLIEQNFRSFFEAVQYRVAPNSPNNHPVDKASMAAKLAMSLSDNELRLLSQFSSNPSSFRYFDNALAKILTEGIIASSQKLGMQVGQKIRVVDAQQRERLSITVGDQESEKEAAIILARAIYRFYPPSANKNDLVQNFAKIAENLIGHDGNMVYDAVRTISSRNAQLSKIKPVTIEVKRLNPIISKGDIITPTLLARVNDYNIQKLEYKSELANWRRPLLNMFWSMMLVIMAGFYLYHIHPEVVRSNRRIAVVGSAVVVALIANFMGLEIFNWISSHSVVVPAALVFSALPMGLVAVVLASLLGFRVALCTGFFVASVTALMLDMSFVFAFKGIVPCLLAALAVRSATNYRSYFLRTAFSVFPVVWILNGNVFFAESQSNQEILSIILISGLLSLANGLITAIIALLLIFVYELVFNVTTNMSLMLMCDYNHPLLERLKREAPGTFFHSLMVATIAEDAARAIKANYLRAKAGALFHDIGKLSKPQYFTENNRDGNWHEELTPQMSSMIIRDHVTEGLILARRYKLAREIIDIVEQHHGTDLVHYFYHKANQIAKERGEEPVPESQFRYTGHQPQSKESAIVSLADACEAACRSLDKPSANRIESMVNDIFLSRFKGHQLSQANMSLAELETIRESFINTLLSMKHGRIAYQNQKKEDNIDYETNVHLAFRKNANSEA